MLSSLAKGLIVSCQAPPNSALHRPQIIAAMAKAAEGGGAVGVRIDGVRNIIAARRRVHIPIIGIEKVRTPGSCVYITPTLDSVRRVSQAGADLIALDCTNRRRPGQLSLSEIIRHAKLELQANIMADVSTLEEGMRAAELGADLVATTLQDHTESTCRSEGPAFDLLRALVRRIQLPIVLEGRVRTPDQVRKAFDLGAHAVVVGTAITGIESLVREFVVATPNGRQWKRHTLIE